MGEFIPGVIELEPSGRIVISRDGVLDARARVLEDGLSFKETSLLSFGIE